MPHHWCSFISVFNHTVPVTLYSPDVRTFLLMDKKQNFSDASEDEDDKVRFMYLFNDYIFSCGLDNTDGAEQISYSFLLIFHQSIYSAL